MGRGGGRSGRNAVPSFRRRLRRNVEHPLSRFLRHGRLLRQGRFLLPGRRVRRRSRGLGSLRLGPGRRALLHGGADDRAPGLGLLQPLDAGLQGRQVSGQGLVTQPQQAQLRVRPAVGAVIQVGGGFLQSGGQIDEAAGRDILPQPVQRGGIVPARQQRRAALGRGPPQQQVSRQSGKLSQHRAHILAAGVQLIQQKQSRLGVPPQHAFHQLGGLQIARQAQHLQHGGGIDGAAGGRALVQQGKAVPQGAVRQAAQQLRAVGGQVDALLPGHVGQALRHVLGGDALEGEPLAPGEDGGGHLVQLRGGQDEHQMLRRLLQNFQQGVEGGSGQHVDLVHDVHPLFHIGRGVNGLVPQGTDLVHAVVGGGVQLQNIQKAAVFDTQAAGAPVAGVAVHRVLAVDGLGQNLGAGGLAGTPGAGKEVGVGGAALGDLFLQGLGNMGLADDVGKRLGPPFSIQGLIHRDLLEIWEVLRMQLRNRRPRVTWNIPLNAARFPA